MYTPNEVSLIGAAMYLWTLPSNLIAKSPLHGLTDYDGGCKGRPPNPIYIPRLDFELVVWSFSHCT